MWIKPTFTMLYNGTREDEEFLSVDPIWAAYFQGDHSRVISRPVSCALCAWIDNAYRANNRSKETPLLCRPAKSKKQTLFMTRFNTSRFLVTSFPGSFPWLGGGTGKGPGNKVSLPALLVSLLCFRRVLIGSLDYRFLRLATKINALFSFNDVQFGTLSMKNK